MTTRIPLITLALGLCLVPARADAASWHFGATFRIGDVHFSIGFEERHPDQLYFRTNVELGRYYYGRPHEYGNGCWQADHHYYHGASCPLISSYARDYGYRSSDLLGYFAPGGSRYDSGYYDDGGYDRGYGGWGRYDRDREYRYDRKWSGRRGRRGGSCPNGYGG